MSLHEIKALTFDTGGTILDWHTGFVTALAETGKRHRIEKDWGGIANELRRRSLEKMLNLVWEEPTLHATKMEFLLIQKNQQ